MRPVVAGLGAALAVASLVVGGLAVGVAAAPPARAAATEDLRLPGGPTSAEDPSPVDLDARLHLPDTVPAPAVVLAHGFGGSKDAVEEEATLEPIVAKLQLAGENVAALMGMDRYLGMRSS